MQQKSPALSEAFFGGDPYGTRTRVSAVKGQRPRPLDEGTVTNLTCILAGRLKGVQCEDGDPYGTRTRVSAVKGQRPRPLDEGTKP